MKKSIPRRILSAMLLLAMVLTLLPATALAEDETGGTTTSGIELSKTATLEDDGTYTINLEAYATGTTTTTTTKSSVPLDIVLVIDQSGSMTDSISSVAYTARDSQGYTYGNMQNTNYYYLAEDGNYYKVSRGNAGGLGLFTDPAYYLSYTDNSGVTHYLSGTTTTTSRPTGVTSRDTIIWTGVLYAATTTTTTKLAALKNSVTSFVETIQKDAQTNNVNHRIAIAGFASDENDGTSGNDSKYSISTGSSSSYWVNTGLFVSGKLKNYGSSSSNTDTQLTSDDYQSALVSVNDNGSVASSITTAISNFAASGGTRTSYGMLMANQVFANNSNTYTDDSGNTVTRKRIVVVFTDGQPGTGSNVNTTEANSAIDYSNTTKSTGTNGYGATVYTVGLYTSTQDSDVTTFMNYLSSNYPSATSMSNGGTQTATKYYMTASNATELNNVFSTITTDATSSSTSVTLDENAVMKDIMAEGFTLTDASKVTVSTYSGSADSNGEITFDATATSTFGTTTTSTYTRSETESYTVTKDIADNTVSVTGFDYADKYISSGHDGEILCVTITGVLPTTSVTTDKAVSTNAATSGIYATSESEEPTATFEQPQTIITKKLYVLDYAKDAALTGLDQSSVTNIVTSYQKVSASTDTTLTQTYGKTALSNSALTYTPTTMSWSGYDSFYVFGQTTNETVLTYDTNTAANALEDGTATIANLWSKVSVIPANNVYYEDDFVTSETTGTVGIVYTGTWSEVGTTNDNTETANGSTHGWETSLANDTTYSDGTARKTTVTTTGDATATFTFTGTGVDVYSYTDSTTGTVVAYLTGTTAENGTSVTKTLIVDNLSESGSYYQIPTLSFNNLKYGTYSVTITVTTAAEGRSTYYLDGIRVYNPLGTTVTGDAEEAYAKDNELNAVFTEVRNILIDANSFTADYDGAGGVVFIDNIPTEEGTGETTTSIATYTDYGPENEVYLKAGQSIAFKVNTDYDYFYLGIKAPNGNTTAAVTSGDDETASIEVNAASDLYYEITPTSEGYIMVENTGSNLLSITKLRATSTEAVETNGVNEALKGISPLSAEEVEEIMVYAASFDSLATVAYTGTGVDEDSAVDTGDTYEDLDGDDVVIDNPTEDTEEEPEETEAPNSLQSLFSSLFSTIRSWFSGRR